MRLFAGALSHADITAPFRRPLQRCQA